jgi:NAD+ kinase
VENSYGFDRYMVSEYTRAMETAGQLGLPNARWYGEYRLTERNWGDLDQYTEEERNNRYADNLRRRHMNPFFWKPPNGESFSELTTRFDRVLNTLHRECSDKRVIMVCHGEVMWAARVAIERMSQERFLELHLSKDPDDRIYNCQIIHYTRRDPLTGELHKHANWRRMIRPTDDPTKVFPWTRIERPMYTNEDLISLTAKTEAMVA